MGVGGRLRGGGGLEVGGGTGDRFRVRGDWG